VHQLGVEVEFSRFRHFVTPRFFNTQPQNLVPRNDEEGIWVRFGTVTPDLIFPDELLLRREFDKLTGCDAILWARQLAL
jgi:hypothetical protein